MSRYEIHEIDLDYAWVDGEPVRRYVVWDRDADRRVPFGIYRTREDAEARIARRTEREETA